MDIFSKRFFGFFSPLSKIVDIKMKNKLTIMKIGIVSTPIFSIKNPNKSTANKKPIDPHTLKSPYLHLASTEVLNATTSTKGTNPLKKKVRKINIVIVCPKPEAPDKNNEINNATMEANINILFKENLAVCESERKPQNGGPIILLHCIGDKRTPISVGLKPRKFNHKLRYGENNPTKAK